MAEQRALWDNSVGDHYIPQYYLKGFLITEKQFWCYDKLNSGKKIVSTIKKIANENKFYSPEVEQYLANNIEGPANIVLNKIRERCQITDGDKKKLAEYMAVMNIRIPHEKLRLKEKAPKICQNISEEMNRDLDIIDSQYPGNKEIIEKKRIEILEICERYAGDPPKDVWLSMIKPESFPKTVSAIETMIWTFILFDKKPVFLTCDNPIFYFPDIGLGNPESEITFPISSHITLWGTRKNRLPNKYVEANSQSIKEINRRTVSNSTKYVFSGFDEPWISHVVAKKEWKLNKLL